MIATQTWDYQGMTFIPNLNFLEFIPEKEHLKTRLDPSYIPQTVLLDEVRENECYEIVITNFHGGSLVRYRIGDMIRITALANPTIGIKLPQMVFERRCDDLIDFNVVRLTEKSIWQALEHSGVAYEDWVAYKTPGEMSLNLLLEPKNSTGQNIKELESKLLEAIVRGSDDSYTRSKVHEDVLDMIKIKLNLTLLPAGSFARYMAQKQAEGADLAHLKPPHVNPQQKVLSALLAKPRTRMESVTPSAVKEPAAIR